MKESDHTHLDMTMLMLLQTNPTSPFRQRFTSIHTTWWISRSFPVLIATYAQDAQDAHIDTWAMHPTWRLYLGQDRALFWPVHSSAHNSSRSQPPENKALRNSRIFWHKLVSNGLFKHNTKKQNENFYTAKQTDVNTFRPRFSLTNLTTNLAPIISELSNSNSNFQLAKLQYIIRA